MYNTNHHDSVESIYIVTQANGFFGASGIPGHVPSMYIHFAHQFMKEIQHHSRQDLVKYLEFFRKGWTFHGKG